MKATIYMATHNKNDVLPNVLCSITRQKVPFPYEVCIVDDHSDVDPEPIIRKFIPDAKYKRFDKQQGFDVVTEHALSLASSDSDILIMQSADVIHSGLDTIEKLCAGVSEKTICMATVRNTNPPNDMHKDFEGQLPHISNQYKRGAFRSAPGRNYFFLGAIDRRGYESLDFVTKPHCDIMLENGLTTAGFKFNHPEGIMGFHQNHSTSTIPCSRIDTCSIEVCALRYRCKQLGWNRLEDYLNRRDQ